MRGPFKKVIAVVLSALLGMGIFGYYLGAKRPRNVEQTVTGRLRAAKKLQAEAQRQGGGGLVDVTGDLEGLAKTFHIVDDGNDAGTRSFIGIYSIDGDKKEV